MDTKKEVRKKVDQRRAESQWFLTIVTVSWQLKMTVSHLQKEFGSGAMTL